MKHATAELGEDITASRGAASAETGVRLGYALVVYVIAVTLLVTLIPFRFQWPDGWRVVFLANPMDIAANIVLFVPLGFLWCFARPRAGDALALPVLAVGAVVSLAIESAQLFEATRSPTLSDVAANAAGAWLGALLYGRIATAARRAGRMIGWVELDLPLMALVYLLVPLLWINSLAAQAAPVRGVTTLLIGAFGAILLGGIQRNYFGPAGSAPARATALFAMLWFMAGAFPSLAWRPVAFAGGAVMVGAICWWQGSQRPFTLSHNRRFEASLLGLAAPIYGGYLALAMLAPLGRGVGEWTMQLGFPSDAGLRDEILDYLEIIAALTLSGYMIAEYRGRSVATYRRALPRLVACGLALAVAIEVVRGYEPGQGASLARLIILAGAVLYGGWLYYLQRAHVVALLANR